MRSSIFVIICFTFDCLFLIQEDIQDVALSRETLLDCFVKRALSYEVVDKGWSVVPRLGLAHGTDTFNDLIV